MLIRINRIIAGPSGTWYEGERHDCPRELAVSLIEQGAAVSLEKAEIETATVAPEETQAVRRRGRPRKKAVAQ